MARVNAFLHLLRTGSPKNSKYVTDNDLLPAAHKRSTKKSSAITAAGDPCWEGYKQVGMKKGRDGEMVPNCVPVKAAQSLEKIQSVLTSDEIEEVLSLYNSKVGGSRQVGLSAAAEVASRSYDAYADSCSNAELADAILWELHSFLEYSTLNQTDALEEISEHNDLLNTGHPATAIIASTASQIEWIAGAPELDESSRDAVIASLTASSDSIESIHATSRVKALVSSGAVSKDTMSLINSLLSN